MYRYRSFFILSLICLPLQSFANNHTQNLSCVHVVNEITVDNYWRIDSSDGVVAYWNKTLKEFEQYNVTKLDDKTVAWNQMTNELNVFVLDKYTMRQSGTIISSSTNGKSKIKNRWFADCVFLNNEDFLNTIGN